VTYLLDTNLVSEWTKPRPDIGVVAWLAEADEDTLTGALHTAWKLRMEESQKPGKKQSPLKKPR